MRTKVVLVDGRKLMREALCVLLEKHGDIKVVGEAEDPDAAPALVKALGAHVVVLNVFLSTHGAADTIRAVQTARPGTHVIILALHASPGFVRHMLKSGAAGFLTNESASEELVTAIRTVVARKMYLSPAIAQMLAAGLPDMEHGTPRRHLSSREMDILRRIADGQTTKEIARLLKVSTKTVETHRRRLMEKLDTYTVAQLTKYAVREGLVSLELQG